MRGRIDFRVITDDDKPYLQALYADSRAWEFELTVWSDAEKVDIGRLIIDRTNDHMLIVDFTIHSDYQNRGIGSDILASLKNEAHGGKVPISLHVRQNSPAINLYLRSGFKKTGVNGHHFAMKWEPDLRPREI